MEIKTLQTNDGPILASAIDLADVSEWPATIAQLRAVVASHLIVGPRFGSLSREVFRYAPTQRGRITSSRLDEDSARGVDGPRAAFFAWD